MSRPVSTKATRCPLKIYFWRGYKIRYSARFNNWQYEGKHIWSGQAQTIGQVIDSILRYEGVKRD